MQRIAALRDRPHEQAGETADAPDVADGETGPREFLGRVELRRERPDPPVVSFEAPKHLVQAHGPPGASPYTS